MTRRRVSAPGVDGIHSLRLPNQPRDYYIKLRYSTMIVVVVVVVVGGGDVGVGGVGIETLHVFRLTGMWPHTP